MMIYIAIQLFHSQIGSMYVLNLGNDSLSRLDWMSIVWSWTYFIFIKLIWIKCYVLFIVGWINKPFFDQDQTLKKG